jgi:hypothetical protein
MSWWHRLLGISSKDSAAAPRLLSLDISPKNSTCGQVSARLETMLPEGWSQHSVPQPGSVLLVRDRSTAPGRVEISYGENKLLDSRMDELGLPNPEWLEEKADLFGKEAGGEQLVRKARGQSSFGPWGSAVFRGGMAYTGRGSERAKAAHAQHWFLMNKESDLLRVLTISHICFETPDADEITEAEQIVLGFGIRKQRTPENSQEPSGSQQRQQAQSDDNEAIVPLEEPPAGFTWERAPQIRAFFLRPTSWHYMSSEHGGQLAYFITKEPMPPSDDELNRLVTDLGASATEQGHFTLQRVPSGTGVSINVWRHVSRVKSLSPSEYARAYIRARKQAPEVTVVGITAVHRAGPFAEVGIEFRDKYGLEPSRQYALLVANDATDTLYHAMFESPAGLWDKEWPIAEKVLAQLVFDPTT